MVGGCGGWFLILGAAGAGAGRCGLVEVMG